MGLEHDPVVSKVERADKIHFLIGEGYSPYNYTFRIIPH